MNVYDIGETAHLDVVFYDEAGDPADPTTVELFIERPDGTVDTVAGGDIINVADEAGAFENSHIVEGPGTTWVRWEGTTGTRVAIVQSYYYARAPRAVPAA